MAPASMQKVPAIRGSLLGHVGQLVKETRRVGRKPNGFGPSQVNQTSLAALERLQNGARRTGGCPAYVTAGTLAASRIRTGRGQGAAQESTPVGVRN